MRRLCCYSLSIPNSDRPDLLTQLLMSVESLRSFNSEIKIVLFAYGVLPGDFTNVLEKQGVQIWQLEPYDSRLAKYSSSGWPYISQYPLLHKCLNFPEISSLKPDQVLLLDCDTYFQDDVARLFEKYAEPDLIAREEVGSRRSHYGYDPTMIDEDTLTRIGEQSGISPALPFNCGVVLLNNGLWQNLAGLSPLFVHYAWRFFVWMAAHPPSSDSEYGEGVGIDSLREAWTSIGPADKFLALEYPSANRWVMDEVTLWMTLGHLPHVSISDFDRGDVAQNGEFDSADNHPDWVVCHYFSQNLERISQWVQHKAQV